jgi:hypothetical protein
MIMRWQSHFSIPLRYPKGHKQNAFIQRFIRARQRLKVLYLIILRSFITDSADIQLSDI